MIRAELCVCGHPQSAHRTYGCTGARPNPDPKKNDPVLCHCKKFQAQKAARAS
jgi:hypothetical protein